jgi:plastocyanin
MHNFVAVQRIAFLALAAGILAGCQMSGSQGSTVNGGGGYNGGNMAGVAIYGYSFSPSSVSFPAVNNVTVTWTNNDPVTHTVTSDTNAFVGGNVTPGGTFSLSFPTPGTYAYHCSIHTGMTGTIIVN